MEMLGNMNSFAKLNDENYQEWSVYVTAVLQELELWNLIIDENPVQASEAAAAVAIAKKEIKAKNVILLNCTPKYMRKIKNCATAKESWNALRQEFHRDATTTKLNLLRKMQERRIQDRQTVKEHLDGLGGIFMQLQDVGHDITENEKVMIILSSLNGKFSNIVTAISAWSEDRLTVGNVQNMLVQHQETMEKKSFYNNPQEIDKQCCARAHGCGPIYDKTPQLPQNVLAGEIQKQIIKSNIYQNRKEAGLAGNKYHENLECAYCHRIGHIKKTCFKLAEVRRKEFEKNRYASDDDSSNVKWFVDSASNKHIVNNLTNYISLDSTYKSSVKGISDVKLRVCGI
jgi:hypothetical protein